MTSYVTPKKGVEFIIYIGLTSQANPNTLQASPTIAAGDFKVSIDGAALANLSTLPAVTPAASKMVKITLSTSEMNGDNITVVCSDAAGSEWCDQLINIQTSARQIDDLAYPATSGRSLAVDAAGLVDANTVKISGDATAADNEESFFDGTGYAGTNNVIPTVTTLTQLTTAVADSTPADGSRPSIAQAVLMITRFLMEKNSSGTTLTVRKEDGSTAVMTFTLDNASAPTSITRAS
jgi:hypothetical protein